MHTDEKKRAHGWEAYITNRGGHWLGRKVAKHIWGKEWVRSMATSNPELAKAISEGLIAATSLFELGGDHILVRLANFVAESMSMENLELLEEFEKNPGNAEVAAKLDAKIEAKVKQVEASVIVALEHVHKDEQCAMVTQYVKDTTPPPRSGKDGKVFTNPSTAKLYPMSMSAALAAHKPLCGLCYPAVSVRKPEEPKAKEKEIVQGRNLMEHLMRFRKDDALMFEIFWTEYLRRMDGPDGPDLARKFQDAFNGRYDYEAFLFVATLPSKSKRGHEEWHHALDALLGKTPPPAGYKAAIEGFIAKEMRQTEDMFRHLFAWIKKGNEERKIAIEKKRERGKELDDEWEAMKAARKRGRWVNRIVFASLAILATAAWFLATTP